MSVAEGTRKRMAPLVLGADRRRLRRHRHLAALHAAPVLHRHPPALALARERARHPVDHLLGAGDRRHAQVRDPDHARRQPRRGRDPRAHRAGLGRARARDAASLVARRLRHLRRRDVLRRRHDHARDLGAGRGRGARDHRAGAAPVHRPGHARHHPRAVRDPEARHGERRHPVRAGDVPSGSSCSRCSDCSRSCAIRTCSARQSHARHLLRHGDPADRLPRARCRRPRGHRHRGALRRHGPLRRRADPAGLDRVRDAGARRQLFRAGRAAARRSHRDQEPVLPARAAMGADPARDPRDVRGGDRVAGGDLGRVLAHPRGDPDGLLPAAQAPSHLRAGDRPDLRAVRQLDAADRRVAARGRLPELGQPGRRLRDRGDARDADRLGADLRRHAPDLALAADRSRWRSRCRSSRSTSRSSRRTRSRSPTAAGSRS